jgi:ABC-type lipoprotein release transport system permease subunit
MTVVALVVRAGLRARWRTWLVLAVLTGLAGGLVTAVAAGARRTDAAYPALVAWSRAPDDLVSVGTGAGSSVGATYSNVPVAAVSRLPQVAASAPIATYTVLEPASASIGAPLNGAVPGTFWRRKLLAGRLPAARQPDEVDVSFTVTQASPRLQVGSTLPLLLLGAKGEPVRVNLRVVGIDAAPAEFPPQYGPGVDFIWATLAFVRVYGARLLDTAGDAVRLRHGAADVPALEREINRMGGGKFVNDYPLGPQAANTQHSIHLQAVALWVLAGVLAVLGLLILGQLHARLAYSESADFGALRGIGAVPGQLTATGLARAALIGGVGAALAVTTAVAISPVFPVGLAGIAEPDSGVHADWTALLLGACGVLVATVGVAAWPAWRAAQVGAGGVAGSAPTGRLSAAGAPVYRRSWVLAVTRSVSSVPVAMGLRLALQRGAGRTAVPVRSAIAATAVGVVGLSAALGFSASLGYPLATPRLYGVAWDALVTNEQFGTSTAPAARSIAADPLIAAWSGTYVGAPLTVNGTTVGGVTTGPGPDGSLAAVALAGRPPAGSGDIVLGQRTLTSLGVRVGQAVSVGLAGLSRHVPFVVTGTAVFPAVSDTTELGTGAELTVAGLLRLPPPGVSAPPYNGLVVKFGPGVPLQQGINSLTARIERLGPYAISGPSTPADLVNFGQLQDLPLLLGLALGLLALLTITHLLLTSVHRRRRDLAVLRALGFTGGQVRATVSWMAVTLAAVALVVGIPVGLLCGRQAWRFFAGQLGISDVARTPVLSLVLLAVAGLALAVAIAFVPGISAGRIRPADALRAE